VKVKLPLAHEAGPVFDAVEVAVKTNVVVPTALSEDGVTVRPVRPVGAVIVAVPVNPPAKLTVTGTELLLPLGTKTSDVAMDNV
jgi:hypothetical protein